MSIKHSLADICWVVAVGLGFMMGAALVFYLFLYSFINWLVIPAALLLAVLLYLASRWLGGSEEEQADPDGARPEE